MINQTYRLPYIFAKISYVWSFSAAENLKNIKSITHHTHTHHTLANKSNQTNKHGNAQSDQGAHCEAVQLCEPVQDARLSCKQKQGCPIGPGSCTVASSSCDNHHTWRASNTTRTKGTCESVCQLVIECCITKCCITTIMNLYLGVFLACFIWGAIPRSSWLIPQASRCSCW